MNRSLLLALLATLAAACGGSHDTRTTANTATDVGPLVRGADGLPVDGDSMDARVEEWRTVHRWVLRPSERCLSGAMDLYVPPATARWAREIRFRMHAPRELTFHVDVRGTPRVSDWLATTMWGYSADEHAKIMREQTACVSQTVALAPSSDASAAAPAKPVATTTKARQAPKARKAPRHPTKTARGRHATVTAPAAPAAPPAEVDVPVSAASPLHGFVSLGDVPYNPLGGPHFFDIEWVIEPRMALIPMNDLDRNWVVHDESNAPLYVRVWTQDPQDLEGAVIEIQDRVLEPRIPEPEYARLMDRRFRAGTKSQNDFMALCRAHPEDKSCYFTAQNRRDFVGADRPPPPPREDEQPPRPGDDYVWIGGGWQWDGSKYEWIAGMWRYVPPAIVATAAGSTQTTTLTTPKVEAPPKVQAPPPSATTGTTSTATTATAPVTTPSTVTLAAPAPAVIIPSAAPPVPTVRVETIPPAPRAGAMWIPGYWTWNGTAWTWTAGQWRMPPERNMRWTPPAVRRNRRGGVNVFLPGGWIRFGR